MKDKGKGKKLSWKQRRIRRRSSNISYVEWKRKQIKSTELWKTSKVIYCVCRFLHLGLWYEHLFIEWIYPVHYYTFYASSINGWDEILTNLSADLKITARLSPRASPASQASSALHVHAPCLGVSRLLCCSSPCLSARRVGRHLDSLPAATILVA